MSGKEIKSKKIETSVRLDPDLRLRVEQKVLTRKYGESRVSFQSAVHEALELWLRDIPHTSKEVCTHDQDSKREKILAHSGKSVDNDSSHIGEWDSLLRDRWPHAAPWRIEAAARALSALESLVTDNGATHADVSPKLTLEDIAKGLGPVRPSKNRGRGRGGQADRTA